MNNISVTANFVDLMNSFFQCNYCKSQPKSKAAKLFPDFIYVESFNSIDWNLYEQGFLGRFAALKKNY